MFAFLLRNLKMLNKTMTFEFYNLGNSFGINMYMCVLLFFEWLQHDDFLSIYLFLLYNINKIVDVELVVMAGELSLGEYLC